MKKLLSVGAAALALAASVALISCGTEAGDDYSGATDTVITLATPSVTAKAYPGYNLVSWQPVSGVEKYELYRYEGGSVTDQQVITLLADKTYYEDTDDLQNNVKYTYKVMAVGNISSRNVYTQDSAAGSASVTAIVPPLTTSALNLAAYEGGYSGTEKTLSSTETSKYLLSADLSEITSNKGSVAVAIPAKAYLDYAVMLSAGDLYSVNNVFSSTTVSSGDTSTIVNNTTLPMVSAVTTAGEYAVYVKATAKSPYFVNSDVVKVGTVTYDAVEASSNPAITSVAYTDNGKTARLIFTPATYIDGTTSATTDYVVYKTVTGESGYTAVSGTVKAYAATTSTYYVDDEISDNTVKYTYTLVLTKDGKYGTTSRTATLAAYSQAAAETPTISASTLTLDTDNVTNDIKWTVTVTNAETTFSAYVLYKGANYTGTPVASDFDTTTALTFVSEDNTNGLTSYAYTKDATEGKAYLLVVTSRDGYKDTYTVSNAVTISAATVSAPTLSVNKYDNTVTGATTTTATVNDVIINVTDDIDVESDSIANYTYTLYRTTSTVTSDISSGTITFDYSAADWTSIGTVTMSSNEAYDSTQTTVTYVGVVKQSDLSDGVYAYKVVKSNGTTSATSDIEYVTITATDDANEIIFTPYISASWDDATAATSKVTVRFTKATASDGTVAGTTTSATNGGETRIVSYTSAAAETGVTYTLYRLTSEASDSETSVVYTKIGTFGTPGDANAASVTVYTYADSTWTEKDSSYIPYVTYKYEDTGLSTGNGYSYIVVASKSGVADVISNSASVAGAN